MSYLVITFDEATILPLKKNELVFFSLSSDFFEIKNFCIPMDTIVRF